MSKYLFYYCSQRFFYAAVRELQRLLGKQVFEAIKNNENGCTLHRSENEQDVICLAVTV